MKLSLALLLLPALAAAQNAAGSASRLDSELASFGAGLIERDSSLTVAETLPGTRAEEMHLSAGDRLLYLNGAAVKSKAEAAAALRSWTPETRLAAIVGRGLQVEGPLEDREPEAPPAFARGPGELSAREALLKEQRLRLAASQAEELLSRAPNLDFEIPAGQAFWLRFPQGIGDSVAVGDSVSAELTTAVASDADLDYLSLPPKTQLWARVLEASSTRDVRKLRLLFFKMKPEGGHYYAITGLITDILGDQKLSRVSSGGTIVLANPLAGEPARKFLIEPDLRLRGVFTSPVSITEPPPYYRAGPGLWLRTKDSDHGHVFEISHVIVGRSADRAGLSAGAVITAINDKAAGSLDFGEALLELYGGPSTAVKLALSRTPGAKPEIVELTRGLAFDKNGGTAAVALPFAKSR